jgi:exonuclease SbcD
VFVVSGDEIRVLLVADTHLGFDLPFRPRIERRRRGHDFFANLNRALQPALRGEVDLVVHGGDLFYRSRVPAALVEMAMTPLVRVADTGTPVYLVPGNHERGSIPLHLWTAHPNLHIFDRPRTFLYTGPRGSLALSGFPFARRVRDRFGELVSQTGYKEDGEVARLLCMHQTVEGAQVGVQNFTFRSGVDVVRGRDIPPGFRAVLCGHIHRGQVLRHDLGGRRLAAPVIYPGSVERTSFAERMEDKGYAMVRIRPADHAQAGPPEVTFRPLPARPMVSLVFEPRSPHREALVRHLASRLEALDPDSVVRVQLHGPHAEQARSFLSAADLRDLAPSSMNISLAPERPQRG